MNLLRIEQAALTAPALAAELIKDISAAAARMYPNDPNALEGFLADLIVDATEHEFIDWLADRGTLEGVKDINNLDVHHTLLAALTAKEIVTRAYNDKFSG